MMCLNFLKVRNGACMPRSTQHNLTVVSLLNLSKSSRAGCFSSASCRFPNQSFTSSLLAASNLYASASSFIASIVEFILPSQTRLVSWRMELYWQRNPATLAGSLQQGMEGSSTDEKSRWFSHTYLTKWNCWACYAGYFRIGRRYLRKAIRDHHALAACSSAHSSANSSMRYGLQIVKRTVII